MGWDGDTHSYTMMPRGGGGRLWNVRLNNTTWRGDCQRVKESKTNRMRVRCMYLVRMYAYVYKKAILDR